MLTLVYLKGSKEVSASYGAGVDARMWNVVAPKLEGYNYATGNVPTFTLEGLRERGLIR